MLRKEEDYVRGLLIKWQGKPLEDFIIANPHIDNMGEGYAISRDVGNSRFKFQYVPKEMNPEDLGLFYRTRRYVINLLTTNDGRIEKSAFVKVTIDVENKEAVRALGAVVVLGILVIITVISTEFEGEY
jgi:hypothetical protein